MFGAVSLNQGFRAIEGLHARSWITVAFGEVAYFVLLGKLFEVATAGAHAWPAAPSVRLCRGLGSSMQMGLESNVLAKWFVYVWFCVSCCVLLLCLRLCLLHVYAKVYECTASESFANRALTSPGCCFCIKQYSHVCFVLRHLEAGCQPARSLRDAARITNLIRGGIYAGVLRARHQLYSHDCLAALRFCRLATCRVLVCVCVRASRA